MTPAAPIIIVPPIGLPEVITPARPDGIYFYSDTKRPTHGRRTPDPRDFSPRAVGGERTAQ